MSETLTVYGIPNCDTVKKARKWLDKNGVSYEFHDYKKKGIDRDALLRWSNDFGWETLLNRRGTTWRKLPDVVKADLTQAKAIALMIEHTSLIKRPVVEIGDQRLAGFSAAEFERFL